MRVIEDKIYEEVIVNKPLICPYCNCELNTATQVDAYTSIQNGDYSICVGCGEIVIHVIDNINYILRKSNENDIELAKQNNFYDTLIYWQNYVRTANHGLKVK